MAIAFDTSTVYSNGTGTSLTFSHTCSGANRILFVSVGYDQGSGSPTGVTYAGISMTLIGTAIHTTPAPFGSSVQLYYLIAPSIGANNIVISITNPSARPVIGISASYTGVKQTGQPDASSAVNRIVTTNYSQSVTTVADNCWSVMAGIIGGPATAGANTVLHSQELIAYGTLLADSNSAQTPSGTDTLSFNNSSLPCAGVMASFSPFIGSGNSAFLMFI